MRKYDPVRFSSIVGESWHHFSFKTKYCHTIFDDRRVREETHRLLIEALERNDFRYEDIGFDRDHVHGMVDIGNDSRPQVAKKLKGYVARKLFQIFPDLKKNYFWDSGLWNPASWIDSIGKDKEFIRGYIRKQRYYSGLQTKLCDF